jgi:molecular chaperone GrpE (heat shock protein)
MMGRETNEELDTRIKRLEEEAWRINKELKAAIRKRTSRGRRRIPAAIRDEIIEQALEIVDVGYRELAKEMHPDAGGSTEGFQRLNAVRAELRAKLR